VRRELPKPLADIGTPEAAAALLRHREHGDVRLDYRVLKALNHVRERNRGLRFPASRVDADLDHDLRSWCFAFVHYRSCPIGAGRNAERFLCIVLNERMDQALNRMFRRLALVYSPDEIHASYRGILSETPRTRGNALEYLQNALAAEHAARVMPLVDGSGEEARLRHAEQRFGLRVLEPTASLGALIESSDSWLRTCALYVAGAQRHHALRDRVEIQLAAREPFVREAALWARSALA